MNRIITISRQFGSGGRTIGKQVARELGIPCYDSEIIEKLSEESGFGKEYIAERGEAADSASWFSAAFARKAYEGRTYDEELWLLQSRILKELAEKESCVIVGRCADVVLRDTADCLNAFVFAEESLRAKRIVEQYGERTETPIKRLRDKDKRRAAYYQFYTDQKWGVMENYHISLDSGVLGIDACVRILKELY